MEHRNRPVRFLKATVFAFAWSLWLSPPSFAQYTNVDWSFTTIEGKTIKPFDEKTTKAVAFIFISADCPIANAYHPHLKQLGNAFSEKGITILLVHASRNITLSAATKHAREFKLSLPIVMDTEQSLADHLKAKVTPEAIVISSETKQPIYRGAIDNLYAGYGKKRHKATQYYLKDALESIVSNKPIAIQKTKPIGCFISYDE